jgi:hypothetical protein
MFSPSRQNQRDNVTRVVYHNSLVAWLIVPGSKSRGANGVPASRRAGARGRVGRGVLLDQISRTYASQQPCHAPIRYPPRLRAAERLRLRGRWRPPLQRPDGGAVQADVRQYARLRRLQLPEWLPQAVVLRFSHRLQPVRRSGARGGAARVNANGSHIARQYISAQPTNWPPIWPHPASFSNGTSLVQLSAPFSFNIATASPDLTAAVKRYQDITFPHVAAPGGSPTLSTVILSAKDTSGTLQLETDESYGAHWPPLLCGGVGGDGDGAWGCCVLLRLSGGPAQF